MSILLIFFFNNDAKSEGKPSAGQSIHLKTCPHVTHNVTVSQMKLAIAMSRISAINCNHQ